MAATTAANLVPDAEIPITADEPGVLGRAKQGEAQAFFALFQAYATRIYCLSLSATRDVTVAENLTRDIFVSAFTCLDDIHDAAGFAARLYRHAAKKSLRIGPNTAALKASGIGSDRISISASSGTEIWPYILNRLMRL